MRGGKIRGTGARYQCEATGNLEAGMCEAQRTTGAAGFVIGCEPLKRN